MEDKLYEAAQNQVIVAVAEQIVSMIENNVISGYGIEPFEGWCEDGEVFTNNGANEVFANECMELVRKVSPIVDKLSENLNPHQFETLSYGTT